MYLNKIFNFKRIVYVYLVLSAIYLLCSYKTLQNYSGKGISIFCTLFFYIGITFWALYRTNLQKMPMRYYAIGFLAGILSISTFLPISTISLLIGSLVAISCLCSVSLLKNQNDISVRKKDMRTDIVILIIFIIILVFILGGYTKLIRFTEFAFIEKCIIVLRALAAGVSEEIMFRMVLYLLLMGNKYTAKFPILIYFIMIVPFTMSHFLDAIAMGELFSKIPDIFYIGMISVILLETLKKRGLLTAIAIHSLIDFFAFI